MALKDLLHLPALAQIQSVERLIDHYQCMRRQQSQCKQKAFALPLGEHADARLQKCTKLKLRRHLVTQLFFRQLEAAAEQFDKVSKGPFNRLVWPWRDCIWHVENVRAFTASLRARASA